MHLLSEAENGVNSVYSSGNRVQIRAGPVAENMLNFKELLLQDSGPEISHKASNVLRRRTCFL